jgi:hypothetical protein
MILKYLTRVEKNGESFDRWNYVDGLNNCSTYYDKDSECICVDMREDKGIVLAIHDKAYLLNNEGKTIDKVF